MDTVVYESALERGVDEYIGQFIDCCAGARYVNGAAVWANEMASLSGIVD